jgi:HEAT repeats
MPRIVTESNQNQRRKRQRPAFAIDRLTGASKMRCMTKMAVVCLVLFLVGCGTAENPKPAVELATTLTNEVQSVKPPPSPLTNTVAEVAPSNPSTAPVGADTFVDLYLQVSSETQKQKALRSLTHLNSEEALTSLVTLFSLEADNDLRADILGAMSGIKSSNTVWSIAQGLDTAYVTDVRLAAIEALEDADQTNAIPYLQPLLSDPSAEIRKAAAHAIDWVQTPELSPEQMKELNRRLQQFRQSRQNKGGG